MTGKRVLISDHGRTAVLSGMRTMRNHAQKQPELTNQKWLFLTILKENFELDGTKPHRFAISSKTASIHRNIVAVFERARKLSILSIAQKQEYTPKTVSDTSKNRLIQSSLNVPTYEKGFSLFFMFTDSQPLTTRKK